MITCKNCGTENNDNFKYCTSCGMDLSPVEVITPPQPEYSAAPVPQRGNGMAVASMVLGIVGLFCMIDCSILAIVFSCIARAQGNTSSKPKTGLICGIIGIATYVLFIFVYFSAVVILTAGIN